MRLWFIVAMAFFALAACGTKLFSPNPGEILWDAHFQNNNLEPALEFTEWQAKAGEPWAELRMGTYYEIIVSPPDSEKAIYWLEKASRHQGDDDWSKGDKTASGPSGYFDQNRDALVAQHSLAALYSERSSTRDDLIKGYLYSANVLEKAGGRAIYFCCDTLYVDVGGQKSRLDKITAQLTEDELEKAKGMAATWSP